MAPETLSFSESAHSSLQDAGLQGALKNVTAKFMAQHKFAASQIAEWESWRSCAHAIKKEAIEHLDVYLEKFARQVERNGGRTYWARNAGGACEYIARLAREQGAHVIVKSKSMTTEEIGLNHVLTEQGLEVIETDLGEYILQLLGDRPSHILAPAIHKTKKDVARLFVEKLGMEYTEDAGRLTAAARSVLRRRFLEAGVGVSGVNFGVTETGTIVIVENEGNVRMATSLPRVHVAVMGIEKLIPRLDDLPLFLQLLARAASGQKIPTYVSLITGVKSQVDREGPEELHVILLDNGRTRIAADPRQRESLSCIRCGACLNFCPVYQKAGGHAYGSVYQGPIGSILTPQLAGLKSAPELPFASSLCGACKDACPVKINIPELLLDLRSKMRSGAGGSPGAAPWRERMAMKALAFVLLHPRLYRAVGQLARLAQKACVKEGYVTRSGWLGRLGWTRTRDFPALAPHPFRKLWEDGLRESNNGRPL